MGLCSAMISSAFPTCQTLGSQGGLRLPRVNYAGIGGEQVSEAGEAGRCGGQVGARSRSDPELVNSGAESRPLWMSWGAWPWGPHT